MEELRDELIFVYPEVFKPEMGDKPHLVYRPVTSLYQAIDYSIKSYYPQKHFAETSPTQNIQYYILITEDEIESFLESWKPPPPTSKYNVHILAAAYSWVALDMNCLVMQNVDNIDMSGSRAELTMFIRNATNMLLDPPACAEESG